MNSNPVQQRTMPNPHAARPVAAGTRAISDLSRIEDHDSEDQVRTFCTEGTPMNFLSTATSMNELHKVRDGQRDLFPLSLLKDRSVFCH